MEFLTVVAGVFVGTIAADILVAAIVTLRTKKAYSARMEEIRSYLAESRDTGTGRESDAGYR